MLRSGPPPHQFNQGPVPPQPQGLGPMFAGPQGHDQQHPSGMYEQYPGMYQGGGGPPTHGYNGGYEGQHNMHPGYGGQDYYNQQAPMHGYPNHGAGGMGQASDQYYPRPHINPSFLPPENPPAAQEKPTKILRNPYPTITKEEIRSQQKDEIYDPSNPTLSTAANSNSNNNVGPRNTMDNSQSAMGYQRQHQPQNQQPPVFHQQMQMAQQHSQAPQHHQYHQPAPSAISQHSQAPQQPQYHQSTHPAISQPQPMAAPNVPPRMAMFENMSNNNTPNYNSAQSHQMSHQNQDAARQEQPDSSVKMQVMTGLVTHISPGAFGMISDEIFYQESCVTGPGPKPKVGDKVVVEAEPVKGMPFKYNAKKVTKLDADLVRNDNNAANNRPTPTAINIEPQRRYERQDFGPLPTMPESLNLPKPCPPANLSSMIPSNSQPLKSILKRKGSPPMKRNPPPPPVISKAGVLDNLKPASASSFKPGVFAMDLDRGAPGMFNASNPGPPLDFAEYTYVRDRDEHRLEINPEPIRQTSPRITRLLPSSPVRERDYADYGRQRAAASPVVVNDMFERRDRSPTFRNKSRSKSPKRDSVRRRSVSPKKKSRRSSSRSKSPRDNRRFKRSRSKSGSPKRSSRVARSPTRRRSRSASPRSRRRSTSTTTRSRRRSRSVTPRSRRCVSRSPDRRRSTSRPKHRPRRSSRSKSKSPSRRRRSRSSIRSASPTPSSSRRSATNMPEPVSHGIHVKTVSSNLYPTIVDRGDGTLVLSKAGITSTTSKSIPVPIKFQIANPPKQQSLVPNPTFKGVPVGANYVQNPMSITKTVSNPTATTQGNAKKKPKEQEPAFRVVEVEVKVPEKPQIKTATKLVADEKIKQWEAERQALKSKVVTELTSDNLLKNPVKVLQLKQTIQNDLHQLRSKENNSNAGVKLLENPTNIQQLRQTVERDLQELRNKEMPPAEKTDDPTQKSSLNIQHLKSSVQQGLKELRTKFDSQVPAPKALPQPTENRPGPSSSSNPAVNNNNNSKAPAAKGAGNGATIPTRVVQNNNSSERAKNVKKSTQVPSAPPASENDEEMERIKEDIHRQRFVEEEHRLRSMGDQRALKQLYYMEDRRQRRLEERHLSRIRMKEIQLKKDKNFGELSKLREAYGPPAERLNQERELRQARMEEEMQESQLHGQAEAIRRQEFEYQSWLDEEANARREAERSSRGFEGRVKRRRTPSPPIHPHNQGPPPHMQHGRSRRRSRSASYERYRDDYRRRSHRSRSREMEYDQFVMAHGGMHNNNMPHPMEGPGFHPPHPHYDGPPPGYGRGPPPPGHFEQEGFYISRAMDNVSRRQEEIMQQEMEIEQRMEMAGRRMGGHPPPGYGHPPQPPHHPNRDDGEYGRFVVRRR
ncbi:Cell division cycle and apoptosis regulator protein 1 [Orchesella cincta]|uniref:Cell division cycle and apoptosis regulator protein 1 n=1 Tax=Orchesella cincta TaxID=48709 RepID=A0A1D2NJU5_ORCCI|nr:Cell division cycle and apoptosis regulator protein 1 [Orchesella cincta]